MNTRPQLEQSDSQSGRYDPASFTASNSPILLSRGFEYLAKLNLRRRLPDPIDCILRPEAAILCCRIWYSKKGIDASPMVTIVVSWSKPHKIKTMAPIFVILHAITM